MRNLSTFHTYVCECIYIYLLYNPEHNVHTRKEQLIKNPSRSFSLVVSVVCTQPSTFPLRVYIHRNDFGWSVDRRCKCVFVVLTAIFFPHIKNSLRSLCARAKKKKKRKSQLFSPPNFHEVNRFRSGNLQQQ